MPLHQFLMNPGFQGLAQLGLGGLQQFFGLLERNRIREQLERESAEAFPNDRGGLPGLPTRGEARSVLGLGPRAGSFRADVPHANSVLGRRGETRPLFGDERILPQLSDPRTREHFADTLQGTPNGLLRFDESVENERTRVSALDRVGSRNARLQPLIDKAQGLVDDPNIISQDEMAAILRQATESNAASTAARNRNIEDSAARSGRASVGTAALKGQSFESELSANSEASSALAIANALERRATLFSAIQETDRLQGVANRNEDLELSLQTPTSLSPLLDLGLAIREGRRQELLGFQSSFADFLTNSGQTFFSSGQETLNQKLIADALSDQSSGGGLLGGAGGGLGSSLGMLTGGLLALPTGGLSVAGGALLGGAAGGAAGTGLDFIK